MKTDRVGMELPDEREYPAQLLERFELLECFCAREDSQTLLARDRANGELYVVKCFPAGSPLYDRPEPEALRRLDCPPLPAFFDEYRDANMRCELREYVPGETLGDVAAQRSFSDEEIISIGEKLCAQLEGLHGQPRPIIHRDIKPRNVVLRPDGTPVLIDFGISRVYSESSNDTVVFGTQGFAPPEQYGFSQTDCRSDIYALGILLNWLLTGKTEAPAEAKTPLERVIRRCTAFDPHKRYAGAGQVRRALNRARPRNTLRRRILAAAGAVCAILCVALGIRAATRSASREAVFSRPLIERAARMNLGLADGERLTQEALAGVTGLYVVADEAFADADGFYSAVDRWYADGRDSRGGTVSLEDLSMMPNLKQVCLAAQQIEDISPLAGLEALDKVELKHNYITDISALAGMERLTSVGINDNPVRDISPLVECPNLAFLDLCDVRSYDASAIARLGNFDMLDIANSTDSYNYLDGKSILALHLSWTGLTDLHALDGVTRLEDLQIAHTAVVDLAPLTVHAGLKQLNIAGIPAQDLSPLLDLPRLETLIVSADMLPLVEALGDTRFEVRVE